MAVVVDNSALRSVTPVFICVHCDTESDREGFIVLTAQRHDWSDKHAIALQKIVLKSQF